MSFSVTLTSDPYPTPVAAKTQASSDHRPAREGRPQRHGSHTHGQGARPDEEAPGESAPSASSALVGRLIDVRV